MVPERTARDPFKPAKLRVEAAVFFRRTGSLNRTQKEEVAAIPAEKRPYYILQERLSFEPVIETPFGGTKAEVRVMYVWLEELMPVLTIIRMGRGLMMGVDHNKDMEWVGASTGLYSEDD